jgi:hypothetical protein
MAVFRRADGEVISTYRYRDELGLAVATADYILVPTGDGSLLVFEHPPHAPSAV